MAFIITYNPETDVLYIQLRDLGEKWIRNLDGFKNDGLSGVTYETEIKMGDLYPAEALDPEDLKNVDILVYTTIAFEIRYASKVLGLAPQDFTVEIKEKGFTISHK